MIHLPEKETEKKVRKKISSNCFNQYISRAKDKTLNQWGRLSTTSKIKVTDKIGNLCMYF